MAKKPRLAAAPKPVLRNMSAAEVEGIVGLMNLNNTLNQRLDAITSEARARFGLPQEIGLRFDLNAKIWVEVPNAPTQAPGVPQTNGKASS